MLKQFIRPTQVVRSVMRAYGQQSYEIWTNKYKDCRTVKCYATGQVSKMIEQIRAELIGAGVKEFTIKTYKDANSSEYLPPAVIVRIPNTEQA